MRCDDNAGGAAPTRRQLHSWGQRYLVPGWVDAPYVALCRIVERVLASRKRSIRHVADPQSAQSPDASPHGSEPSSAVHLCDLGFEYKRLSGERSYQETLPSVHCLTLEPIASARMKQPCNSTPESPPPDEILI
ncbi:MAG TPA: hypothetical protein VFP68_11985 [Burkholderiaceae bacterium]|nr:hypothetical protein [Burkholderiaceae bacterium]